MTLPAAQRGSLLIVAVVMIVVIGFLASTVSYLAVGQVHGNLNQAMASKALFIADSGLQHGIRQWSLTPTTYAGEGPVVFGDGDFTITVSATDSQGNPLPANRRRISSSGRVAAQNGDALRVSEAIVQIDPAGIVEPFPNISRWSTAGPNGDVFNLACPAAVNNTTVPSNNGWVTFDAAENAPASSGGALRAEVDPAVANNRLSGYREHFLTGPIGEGVNLSLDFWYRKIRDGSKPDAQMMAIDLVASDNSVYRLWSDCQERNIKWSNAVVNWTVPAGKSINRVRLAFDVLRNDKVKAGDSFAILFDQINLSASGVNVSHIVTWREVVP